MAFTPIDPTKAEVRVIGEAPNQQLDFYIPRGAKGEPGGWNNGTDLATTTNLNDIKVPGLYRNWNNTAATALNNYPVPVVNSTCVLEVIVAANPTGDVVQRLTPIIGTPNLRAMYIRRCISGVWSDWRTFATTRVDQTAGRAIYQWDDTNNREQLIYGDTGWRQLTPINGWTASQIIVRRMGYQVTVSALNLTGTNATSDIATDQMAVGFRPSGFLASPRFPVMYSNGPDSSRSASVDISLLALRLFGSSYTSISSGHIVITYPTADAWPTTLPGTAVGTIPNV